MVDHQETPRLSGALRAQRDSNRPDLLLTPSDNYKLLTTKRRKCSSTGTRDWSALCGDVVKLCSKTHAVKVAESVHVFTTPSRRYVHLGQVRVERPS